MHTTLFNFRVFVWCQLGFCFPLSLFLLLYKVTAQLMTLLRGGGPYGGAVFWWLRSQPANTTPPPPSPSSPLCSSSSHYAALFSPFPPFSFGSNDFDIMNDMPEITGTRTNDYYYQTKSKRKSVCLLSKFYLKCEKCSNVSNFILWSWTSTWTANYEHGLSGSYHVTNFNE